MNLAIILSVFVTIDQVSGKEAMILLYTGCSSKFVFFPIEAHIIKIVFFFFNEGHSLPHCEILQVVNAIRVSCQLSVSFHI